MSSTNIKNLAIAEYLINLRAIFVIAMMSTCPAKDADFADWNMDEICDQNDIDRPSPNNGQYREILQNFESIVFDEVEKHQIVAFLNTVLGIMLEHFESDLTEVCEIDRTDPLCVIRFLQSIYTNYLEYVDKNSSKFTTALINESQSWKGGTAEEFTTFIRRVRKMLHDLPPKIRQTFNDRMVIDHLISTLLQEHI